MAAMTETERIKVDVAKKLAAKQAQRTKAQTAFETATAKAVAADEVARNKSRDKFTASMSKLDTEISELLSLQASLR